MYIHKEGYATISITAISAIILSVVICSISLPIIVKALLLLALIAFCFLIVFFFRMPKRNLNLNEKSIICPADGVIVAIENVFVEEHLKKECKQVSIFMSPLNIHVNRYPVSGRVTYATHHHGKYLVASHPKSSELNERTTVVVDSKEFGEVLIRQIAGAVARRIVCYSKQNQEVKQGEELGFIKFGSRVDVFLPKDTKIKVKLNQKVKGGITEIA